MMDIAFKIKVLFWFMSQAFKEWRVEIWRKDPDSRYCCNGNLCCCGGRTIRETYDDDMLK